jgi:hypothetical protein
MKIYELQNIGKGVIQNLYEENFLLIDDSQIVPSLDQVMYANGGRIQYGHIVYIEQVVSHTTPEGGNGPQVIFTHPSNANGNIDALYSIGLGADLYATAMRLLFYRNRTVFRDNLNNKGLEYDGDYELNFTPRSLVTRQYVDTNMQSTIKQVTATLASWLFDRNYSVNTGLTGIFTIVAVVPYLRCISPSDGYIAGDIINVPTPEVNDSGGLSPQGIGVQFKSNSSVVNLMIDGRLAIKQAYNSTPSSPVVDINLSDSTKWQIDLCVLYK